jgi:hypothetical protein
VPLQSVRQLGGHKHAADWIAHHFSPHRLWTASFAPRPRGAIRHVKGGRTEEVTERTAEQPSYNEHDDQLKQVFDQTAHKVYGNECCETPKILFLPCRARRPTLAGGGPGWDSPDSIRGARAKPAPPPQDRDGCPS